jgi:hypothetical protein
VRFSYLSLKPSSAAHEQADPWVYEPADDQCSRLAKLTHHVRLRYDAHALDPLAGLQFTTGTFYMLASSIKQVAKELCGGRCVFFLEGGYNLQSLSSSVADTFRAFLDEPSLAAQFDDPAILFEEPTRKIKEAIEKAKSIHSL